MGNSKETGTGGSFWFLAFVLSLLAAALLTVLYQICFVAVLLVSGKGFAALLELPRFLSSWWPDPAAFGVPLFLFALLALEPIAFAVFFVAAFVFIAAMKRKNEVNSARRKVSENIRNT